MNDSELDTVYTRLCETMTELGQAQAPLLLVRFALLAMVHIDDAPVLLRMIDEAAENLAAGTSSAGQPSGDEPGPQHLGQR